MLKDKLNTEPYKGVRDFYPTDYAIRRHITDIMEKTAKLYGYEQYDASILEPSQLYENKTSQEIVSEQTYTFIDRGERKITLRPEITPTVVRMIAGKNNSLPLPIRWFSIPNLFRYERTQKGRFREHWQFNADLFGLSNLDAEVEIITLARDILLNLGLKDNDYLIKLNSRVITNFLFGQFLNLNEENTKKLARLIDKKSKISNDKFESETEKILGRKDDIFLALIFSKNFTEFSTHLPKNELLENELKKLTTIIERLNNLGINNITIDQSLIRGFDYYTGTIFEFYDIDPKNNRALLGGGRYDKLFSNFGVNDIPTVGFGMGDAVLTDSLKSRDLLPKYNTKIKLGFCILDNKATPYVNEIAQKLRNKDINILVNYSYKKPGEQIKDMDKRNVQYIVCVGQDEIDNGEFVVKNLNTGLEEKIKESDLEIFLKNKNS